LQLRVADATGASNTTVDIVAKGAVTAGVTRRYQLWYRDPVTSPCASWFNLTNAYEVTWVP